MTSSRTTAEKEFSYRTGETIKVKSGYKVRASADATASLFSHDTEETEFTLNEGATALGNTIAVAAAVMATLIASL